MTQSIPTDLESQLAIAVDQALKKSDISFTPEYTEKGEFKLIYRYLRPRFRWPKLKFIPKNKILKSIFWVCQSEDVLSGTSSMMKKEEEGGD